MNMINDKVIISLAVLKVNWDCKKQDYIESFVPFVVTLINKNKYTTIDTATICEDFQSEFGLIIPDYPMMTILRRVKSRGFIKILAGGTLSPVWKKIKEKEFSELSKKQIRIHEKVISEFIKFSKQQKIKYNVIILE